MSHLAEMGTPLSEVSHFMAIIGKNGNSSLLFGRVLEAYWLFPGSAQKNYGHFRMSMSRCPCPYQGPCPRPCPCPVFFYSLPVSSMTV
jgi:hypothetical protein